VRLAEVEQLAGHGRVGRERNTNAETRYLKVVNHIIVLGRRAVVGGLLVGGWRLRCSLYSRTRSEERAVRRQLIVKAPLTRKRCHFFTKTLRLGTCTNVAFYRSRLSKVHQKAVGTSSESSPQIIRSCSDAVHAPIRMRLEPHSRPASLQRPFAPLFQRIEAQRSLKNSDDLHSLQRFRVFSFSLSTTKEEGIRQWVQMRGVRGKRAEGSWARMYYFRTVELGFSFIDWLPKDV
jgi:hypothetical protein